MEKKITFKSLLVLVSQQVNSKGIQNSLFTEFYNRLGKKIIGVCLQMAFNRGVPEYKMFADDLYQKVKEVIYKKPFRPVKKDTEEVVEIKFWAWIKKIARNCATKLIKEFHQERTFSVKPNPDYNLLSAYNDLDGKKEQTKRSLKKSPHPVSFNQEGHTRSVRRIGDWDVSKEDVTRLTSEDIIYWEKVEQKMAILDEVAKTLRTDRDKEIYHKILKKYGDNLDQVPITLKKEIVAKFKMKDLNALRNEKLRVIERLKAKLAKWLLTNNTTVDKLP